jgi:hypothetical protein
MKKTFFVIVAALMFLVGAGAAIASPPEWTPGVLSNTEDLIGVQFRSFGNTTGPEVLLGVPPYSETGSFTQTNLMWMETNQITFTYDAALDKLTTEVFNGTETYPLEFLDVSDKITNPPKEFTLAGLNFLQITIVNGDSNTTVNFNDVFFKNADYPDGVSLGSFGGNGRYDWSFKDDTDSRLILTEGFTVTGTIRLIGAFTGAETSMMEIKAGHWTENQPPDCSKAEPSIKKLWPPNHQWAKIKVLGVTDPDDDPITIVIDSIFQDEPVNGSGDGNTSPDGKGIGSSAASVRAERQGSGNGRVYHITFTANDGNGGTCSGEVSVGVPKSQGKKGGPVDDGALCDSTAP